MNVGRRIELSWALACLAVAAAWIDFSKIHAWHNSDSVVLELVSLYRWTPFYWEQDRYGMLFPLLALPWSHPLDNLLVQAGLSIFVSLSGLFLLGLYIAGPRLGAIIGALGAIYRMFFTSFGQESEALVLNHMYLTAPALGLAGLVLLDRWARRRHAATAVLGATCILLAHWINPAVAMALGPLVIVRSFCFRNLSDRLAPTSDQPAATGPTWPKPLSFRSDALRLRWAFRCWRVVASRDELLGLWCIGLSLVAALVLSRTLGHRVQYHILPPHKWIASAVGMWNNLDEFCGYRWLVAIQSSAIVGLATLCWPAGRRALRCSVPMVMGLLFAAAVQYVFMSSLDWVVLNQSCARYMMMAVFFWQGAMIGFAVIQVSAVLPTLRCSPGATAMMMLAMTCVAAATHGWPSRAVVRAELDRTLGQYTDDLLAAGCTHVTGDYWHAWTAMFHANLRLADEGSPRRVWAITLRCAPTASLWQQKQSAEMRIGEIIGDEQQSQLWRQIYCAPPATTLTQVGRIRVLCPTDQADGAVRLARQHSNSP